MTETFCEIPSDSYYDAYLDVADAVGADDGWYGAIPRLLVSPGAVVTEELQDFHLRSGWVPKYWRLLRCSVPYNGVRIVVWVLQPIKPSSQTPFGNPLGDGSYWFLHKPDGFV